MYRMYGMSRAHGCAGVTMYRMYGMSRAHGCAGVTMYRMYGMSRAQGRHTGRISVARYVQGCTVVEQCRSNCRGHDCRDAGGRTNQETESRSP